MSLLARTVHVAELPVILDTLYVSEMARDTCRLDVTDTLHSCAYLLPQE